MSLFKQLRPLTLDQAITAADDLQIGAVVAILVDYRPVFVVFVSSAPYGLPYEVDFFCTGDDMRTVPLRPRPLPLTRQQRDRLAGWTTHAVGLICRTWRERHPEA